MRHSAIVRAGNFLVYGDCRRSIVHVARAAKPGKPAGYVVGNRKSKGVVLPTNEATVAYFAENGFKKAARAHHGHAEKALMPAAGDRQISDSLKTIRGSASANEAGVCGRKVNMRLSESLVYFQDCRCGFVDFFKFFSYNKEQHHAKHAK